MSKSNINVALGAMTFGKAGAEQARVHDLSKVKEIIDVFGKHGHKEIDTARMYAFGSSEEYLGQLNVKDEYDLSSKIYAFDESSSGLSGHGKTIHHNAKDIAEQIDIALSNTKAKKFKIWYLHAPDRSVDYLETLKALDEQHKLGKFDILGLSNYPSYEVAEFVQLARHHNLIQPKVYQGVYNAIHKNVEDELFPALRKYGISFYAYNPLAGGLLTGKLLDPNQNVEEGSRFDPNRVQGKGYRTRYFNDAYFNGINQFTSIAKNNNLTPAETALRYLNHHSQLKKENNDAIIIGGSNIHHIEQNLDDLEKGPLPQNVVDEINNLWPTLKPFANSYYR